MRTPIASAPPCPAICAAAPAISRSSKRCLRRAPRIGRPTSHDRDKPVYRQPGRADRGSTLSTRPRPVRRRFEAREHAAFGHDVQQALAEAYEHKLLPGNQILAIRRIIVQRNQRRKSPPRSGRGVPAGFLPMRSSSRCCAPRRCTRCRDPWPSSSNYRKPDMPEPVKMAFERRV